MNRRHGLLFVAIVLGPSCEDNCVFGSVTATCEGEGAPSEGCHEAYQPCLENPVDKVMHRVGDNGLELMAAPYCKMPAEFCAWDLTDDTLIAGPPECECACDPAFPGA